MVFALPGSYFLVPTHFNGSLLSTCLDSTRDILRSPVRRMTFLDAFSFSYCVCLLSYLFHAFINEYDLDCNTKYCDIHVLIIYFKECFVNVNINVMPYC